MTINELNIICNAVDKINSIFELVSWSGGWQKKLMNDSNDFTQNEIESMLSVCNNSMIWDEILESQLKLSKFNNPKYLEKMIANCIILNQANCLVYSSLIFAKLWREFPLFERNNLSIAASKNDNHVILLCDNKITKTTLVIDVWLKFILSNECGFVGEYGKYIDLLSTTSRFKYYDFNIDSVMTEICRNIDFLNIESEVKNGINKAS